MSGSDGEPIIKKIFAGVAIAVISAGIIYIFPALRTFIGGIISGAWLFLLSSAKVPWALLLLLLTLSATTVWRWVVPFFKKEPEEPKIWEYTEEDLFGMLWKWDTLYEGGTPSSDLLPFCQNCGTRLIYRIERNYSIRKPGGTIDKSTVFHCEHCNLDFQPLEGELEFALSTVARQIERRFNSGEWKEAVYRKRREREMRKGA